MITNIFCSNVQKMPKINNTIKNNKTKIKNTKNNPWLLICLFVLLVLFGVFSTNNYYLDKANKQIKELENKCTDTINELEPTTFALEELKQSNQIVSKVNPLDLISTLDFKNRQIENYQKTMENMTQENQEILDQAGKFAQNYKDLIKDVPVATQQSIHNKDFINTPECQKQIAKYFPSFEHFKILPIPLTSEEEQQQILDQYTEMTQKIFDTFKNTCEQGTDNITQLQENFNKLIIDLETVKKTYEEKKTEHEKEIAQLQKKKEELNEKIEENNKINQELKKIKTSKQKMKEFLGNDEHNFNETQSYNSNAF